MFEGKGGLIGFNHTYHVWHSSQFRVEYIIDQNKVETGGEHHDSGASETVVDFGINYFVLLCQLKRISLGAMTNG